MADTKSAFLKRVISGFLAALALLLLGIYGGTGGLHFACTVAVVLGTREYARIAFSHWKIPLAVERFYWAVAIIMYLFMYVMKAPPLVVFACANVVFFVAALWMARAKVANEQLLAALAMGSFGLIYCVLFPFFAVTTAILAGGSQWFLLLLLVVFFGDTFAYFGGRLMGRHKLLPQISPNKTWEGAIAGLAGSCVAGLVHMHLVFPQVPWYTGLGFCIVCGAAAQTGDLLMSLLKRVAQVKDSGHIMPGHGGVLDRLDGIYIACPSFTLSRSTSRIITRFDPRSRCFKFLARAGGAPYNV